MTYLFQQGMIIGGILRGDNVIIPRGDTVIQVKDRVVIFALADAVKRLDKAVGNLEAAVQRRLDADRSLNALQDDLQRLGEDRSPLAASLDESEARASRLEEANRDVSRRLVSAMETIRSVLDAHGG